MTLSLAGMRVAVLGLGISGRSAALFCAERGARVLACDERSEAEIEELEALRRHPDIEVRTAQPFPDAADFDCVVPSPGLPPGRYAARARRAWGDIELCGRALAVPFAAVTGTNGKSTTVSLVEVMLRAAGLRARAAGNLGLPALSLVGEALDAAVLEVSSFQLEATEAFRPRVAAILNISPDHLDRHGDLASYVTAKARILESQRREDIAVLGIDDANVRNLASKARGRVFPFSARRPLSTGVWLDGSSLVLRDGPAIHRISLEGFALSSTHDRENAAAALAIAYSLGADPERAAAGLAAFKALPHRCEFVAEIAGVRFVNDSKATNPDAAQRALQSMGVPIIWIAGGRDKGLDYAPLLASAARFARCALLFGEAAATLEAGLEGDLRCLRCNSLGDAVVRASEIAQAGECVLLAPACSSFDQFANFEERGECFREAVAALAGGSH